MLKFGCVPPVYFNNWYCVSVYMFRKEAKGNPVNGVFYNSLWNKRLFSANAIRRSQMGH